MAILHQAIDGIAHHRGRPIPLVRQFGVGIGGGDMRLIGPPLAAKQDRGIARILGRLWRRVRIQRANPPLVSTPMMVVPKSPM